MSWRDLGKVSANRSYRLMCVASACGFAAIVALTSVAISGSNEIKIQKAVPFEGETTVQVELTIRNCVGRIFDATIKSEYAPTNYLGRAIVLGRHGCPRADWEIEHLSSLQYSRELFFKGNVTVVPEWKLQYEVTRQYLSSCQLSMCRIFQFEADATGSFVGAKMYHVEEKMYLQAKTLTSLTKSPEHFRSYSEFNKVVKTNKKKFYAAVGNVIIFDDGSCALLGAETRKITELNTLESCDNS